MKKGRFQVDPLRGNILTSMILFALPIMGTSVLQMLFSSVDTMVVGRFGGENAMASVGASASVIMLIINAVMGLGTGVSIVAGKRSGRGDVAGVKRLVQTLPLTGLVIGGATTVIACAFARPILELVKCPATLIEDALVYFRIYFLCVPFMLVFTFFTSVLEARGCSFQPFVVQACCGALNLVLNLIFVICFGWGVAGVAVATVISQAASAAVMTAYFVFREKEVPLKLNALTLFSDFSEPMHIGVPSSIQGVLMNISGVIVQTAINGFPENVISGNTVSASIEGMISVAFIGFSSAGMVFVSQNSARNDVKRTVKVVLYAFFTALILGEVLGNILYAFADSVTGLYTDSTEIAHYARLRMLYMCVPYGLCGTMNVMSGCVRGAGAAKTPLVVSFLSSCVFRVAWVLTYAKAKGTVSAIYVSYPMVWAMATVMYVAMFVYLMRKNGKENAIN